MIAADTSSLIAFLAGETGADVDAIDNALSGSGLHLPPVVVTEMLTDRKGHGRIATLIASLPLLHPTDGYWQRAGVTRATVLARGNRAALADTLICQSCLDYDAALITRDADFKPFARYCGLRLA